jgi:hypothetical protein
MDGTWAQATARDRKRRPVRSAAPAAAAAGQPPVATAPGLPPIAAAVGQPPVAAAVGQPPVAAAPGLPSVAVIAAPDAVSGVAGPVRWRREPEIEKVSTFSKYACNVISISIS